MIARRLLGGMLKRVVRHGRLQIIDCDGEILDFGDPSAEAIVLKFKDSWVAFDLLRDPQLTLGELYTDGRLTIENANIAGLMDLLARNLGTSVGDRYSRAIAWLRSCFRPRNSLRAAKRNVDSHYSLDGDLYNFFLDSDKQYSCAFFETPHDTLETAQTNKKRRIAAKLALKPGQKVLDIGSGWGGLSLYLATIAGADVTGVSLSAEQVKISNVRAEMAGVADRVRFQLSDYRTVEEKFDRVVSVGMFEHVGQKHYDEFFRTVAATLADDGVAMIHFIGRSDGPGVTNPWIARYIFPGGYVPALSEVLPAIERSGLHLTDVEVLRMHYARTLLEWRRRFAANRHRAVRALGDRFCRMWEFYLAGAEMAFRYQGQVVFQLQLAKRVDTLPLSRDYMIERREWNKAANARVEMVNGSVDAVEEHAGEALNEFLSQNK